MFCNNIEKHNKKAFTLAELMVIMSVMAVIMAAVAPIFTSRYTNVSLDNVWEQVPASNSNDIFADAPVRAMSQQIIIGSTPADLEDIRTTFEPYSKLIIHSTNQVDGNKFQKQIDFRRGGEKVGYLFAANSNLLLGGNYNSVSFTYRPSNLDNITAMNIGTGAAGNTAFGRYALDSLTTGMYNSALGYSALSGLKAGNANTAVGVQAGSNLTQGNGNVFVGYNSYNSNDGEYNTIIGNNSAGRSSVSKRVTAIGNEVNVKGEDNVAVGNKSNAGGYFNTAVGYGALASENPDSDTYGSFKYNTAVGYNSCSGIGRQAKNITCIGGSGVDPAMSGTAKNFFTEDSDTPRVLIGKSASKFSSAATLEVHNASGNSSYYPYPGSSYGLGNASVIVNGNLVVRGQTYMIGRSPYPIAPGSDSNVYANTVSLMGYRLYKESPSSHKPLIGMDGSDYSQRVDHENSSSNQRYLHQKYNAREHCICAYSCGNSSADSEGRRTYNWSYLAFNKYAQLFSNLLDGYDYYWGPSPHSCGSNYSNQSDEANNIELDRARNLVKSASDVDYSGDVDSFSGGSCCPILTPTGYRRSDTISSDLRLKDVDSPFENGLKDLLKLKIYNYTFKSDKTKTPYVGVIAQDLKQVFPDSVSKDENGYYKIRKEDMFYAAINSVKELYKELLNLTKRLENDILRIVALKNENSRLKQKLVEISKELDKFEK